MKKLSLFPFPLVTVFLVLFAFSPAIAKVKVTTSFPAGAAIYGGQTYAIPVTVTSTTGLEMAAVSSYVINLKLKKSPQPPQNGQGPAISWKAPTVTQPRLGQLNIAAFGAGGELLFKLKSGKFTILPGDVTPPQVVATNPANGATVVLVDTATITATFSEPIDCANLLVLGISGTASCTGNTLSIALLPLAYGANYAITISGATDIFGNVMPDYVLSFTTEPAPPRAMKKVFIGHYVLGPYPYGKISIIEDLSGQMRSIGVGGYVISAVATNSNIYLAHREREWVKR